MSQGAKTKNKIDEAREKLACHIISPGSAGSEGSPAGGNNAPPDNEGAQADFIDENGKVLLTKMTSAGG